MLSMNSYHTCGIRDCSFGVTRSKEGSSRVTCWRNFTRAAYTVPPPRLPHPVAAHRRHRAPCGDGIP